MRAHKVFTATFKSCNCYAETGENKRQQAVSNCRSSNEYHIRNKRSGEIRDLIKLYLPAYKNCIW